MLRPWQVWLAFVACVALAVAAVGWLSLNAIDFSRAESHARLGRTVEEHLRLALSRMDFDVAQRVIQESSRPDFFYSPILPSVGADSRAEKPSPLLAEPPDYAKLYFQYDTLGRLSSPQVPVDEQRDMAIARWVDAERITESEQRLAALGKAVPVEALLLALPSSRPERDTDPNAPNSVLGSLSNPTPKPVGGPGEFYARQYLTPDSAPGVYSVTNVRMTPMCPLWIGGELLLARRVIRNGAMFVQGAVLDWPLLQSKLEEVVHADEMLPNAQLTPILSQLDAEGAWRMRTLPVKLESGSVRLTNEEGWSPLRWALATTWGFLLLAIVAVALLLQGVISLSERRAAFVSAVTHELRTPLTTFRMYADLLAEGMVADEATRRRYLNTLRVEADRLMHLVENVLAFARLERNRPGGRIEPLGVERILDRCRERLAERAHQANFEIVTTVEPDAVDAVALGDPTAVEQILFNLIDNACKYATFPSENLLHVEASKQGSKVLLKVRDHGPGIPEHERRRLFQPFRKSASEAARSAPGVGLGLALCRRMARDMRGELRYEGSPEGACFVLTLPAADADMAARSERSRTPATSVRA